MKTAELFRNKTVLSFEIFPPKPNSDERVIYDTLDGLTGLSPDFISVTYHAANKGKETVRIASTVKHKYGVESVAHLPGYYLTKEETARILDSLKEEGVENILALRGDIRPDLTAAGDFRHADELIAFIKQRYDFNVIGACYPEPHRESESVVADVFNLKRKVDSGADQLISQLFLDNDYFYTFLERAQLAGIRVPVEAGIMPVTNRAQIERMVSLCGITLPPKFMKIIERYEHNAVALRDAGIAYAIDQIVDLITRGVDGIHLYTMNNAYVARKIYEAVHNLLTA